jgi:hypothetical protein
MKRSRRSLALLLPSLALFAITGCGSPNFGDDSKPKATTAPNTARFTNRGASKAAPSAPQAQ